MDREIVVGLHFYQPPREATHPLLSGIPTDPENKNWTKIIEKQCYEPLATEGTLNKISFDIYQSLLLQLEKINPKTADIYKKSMRENGVGEAFIHPILPDLSLVDKNIVIEAGVNRFVQISGIHPKIFWPPETAIDTETLEVLSNNGYEGFICAPEQINQTNGKVSDNQLTQIQLRDGKKIIAYPFDRTISRGLAFDQKNNADEFVDKYIRQKIESSKQNYPIIAWTDAETFGHHFYQGNKFLSYLLDESLPSVGLYPVSINSLILDKSKLPTGKIVERSSWSCPHGNLVRWNGSCDCAYGEDTSWKQSFSKAMSYLNNQISNTLQLELGKSYPSLVSKAFYDILSRPETVTHPETALISAKVSSLIAKTSCATFFSSPEVSGKINLLYAYQSIQYLSDAGLKRTANNLTREFYEIISDITFPNNDETALKMLQKMLT